MTKARVAVILSSKAESPVPLSPQIKAAKAETAGEVSKNWEQLKLSEKGGNKSLLSGVPMSLPSLIKAYRMQEKAANVGFDWEKKDDVWDKVSEEINELRVELERGDAAAAEAEYGDFLFSLVNVSRFYNIKFRPIF